MVSLARLGARHGGRLLLTGADVATIVAPFFADWNTSHLFNERWPSHARFHGVVGLSTPMLLAAFGLVRLWTSAREEAARDFAWPCRWPTGAHSSPPPW